MSEPNEQSKSKPRASRAVSTVMTRAVRKILKQKAQANSKENWADKVGANLISIASEKKSAVGLQAIKMVMDHVSEPIALVADGEESETVSTKAAIRAKSDEELEAEIKELRERLGSVVAASA